MIFVGKNLNISKIKYYREKQIKPDFYFYFIIYEIYEIFSIF